MITSKSEEICNINAWKWVCGDIHKLIGKCFVVSRIEIKFAMLKII